MCAKGKSNLRQKDLKNDGPYPVYGASGIVGFSSDYQNADAYVAVVKDGAGVGRVMACEPRSSVLGTMQALLPGKGTERDYLLHLVRSMDLGKGFTGLTIPHIYFKDYGKTLVRTLSREQQVEVANRLSGIDHLISQGKGQLSLLDDLVKSQVHDYPLCLRVRVRMNVFIIVRAPDGMLRNKRGSAAGGSRPTAQPDSVHNNG